MLVDSKGIKRIYSWNNTEHKQISSHCHNSWFILCSIQCLLTDKTNKQNILTNIMAQNLVKETESNKRFLYYTINSVLSATKSDGCLVAIAWNFYIIIPLEIVAELKAAAGRSSQTWEQNYLDTEISIYQSQSSWVKVQPVNYLLTQKTNVPTVATQCRL